METYEFSIGGMISLAAFMLWGLYNGTNLQLLEDCSLCEVMSKRLHI
jgi:hypothetical protein